MILRRVGQQALLQKEGPLRQQAKRRRLKTAMQEMMAVAAQLTARAPRVALDFGRHCHRSPFDVTCTGAGQRPIRHLEAQPPLSDRHRFRCCHPRTRHGCESGARTDAAAPRRFLLDDRLSMSGPDQANMICARSAHQTTGYLGKSPGQFARLRYAPNSHASSKLEKP